MEASNQRTNIMKNIRWDASEIESLAKRSYLIRKNAISPMSPLEAIRRAQDEVLKPNRRRELTGLSQVDRVMMAWKLLDEQGYGSGQQAITPVVQPQVALKLEDVATADLIAEFMKRLVPMLDPDYIRSIAREEAHKVLESRIPGMLLQPEDIHVEAKEEKKSEVKQLHVCILGLEGMQKEAMRREYGSAIDFHFLDGSEGSNRIRATCDKMDLTIRSRWCKGNLGSTSGWPKFTSAEGGGLDSIKRLINKHFKL
jgi:hypothetical protein